ncbi:MAG: flagellin [Lachnospiraceae bacterium]
MRINYNATAMVAVNALNKNDSAVSKSTERLSTGLKINRAKDNPSGYALSRRMKAQLEGLKQAGDNTSDGINIIETADGAMGEIHDMLQRINELAIKSANGTWSDSDRTMMDEEVQQLKDEIQRVSETTEFNGQKLLNGSFDLKGYTTDINVKVSSYSEYVEKGIYKFSFEGLVFDEDGNITTPIDQITVNTADNENDIAKGATISNVLENRITLAGSKGFEISFDIYKDYVDATGSGAPFEVDVTGLGAMTLQVGANEGQVLDLSIPDVGTKGLGIRQQDVLTSDNALQMIDAISDAIAKVSSIRSKLGAYQNRLESTSTMLDITEENMTEAFSGITDVDMSEEYTSYSTYQILTQASTSVLSQANERPSQVLQLLQ